MDDHAPRRRPIGLALTAVLVSLYAPFAWVLFEPGNWSSYRLLWLKLLPILPGIFPGAWLFHGRSEVLELTTMGLVTVGLIAGLTWLGSRGRVSMVAAIGIAWAVALPSSIAAYAAYRA